MGTQRNLNGKNSKENEVNLSSNQEKGYILGFRAWGIDEDSTLQAILADEQEFITYPSEPDFEPAFLKALHVDDWWHSKKKTAECDHNYDKLLAGTSAQEMKVYENRAPHKGCECGLYARYTLKDISNDVNEFEENAVYGVVKGWGKTLMHKEGFRTEHMEIIALIKNPFAAASPIYILDLKDISRRYAIPLVDLNKVEALVKELGQSPLVAEVLENNPKGENNSSSTQGLLVPTNSKLNSSVRLPKPPLGATPKKPKFTKRNAIKTLVVLTIISIPLSLGGTFIQHVIYTDNNHPVISQVKVDPATVNVNQLSQVQFKIENNTAQDIYLNIEPDNGGNSHPDNPSYWPDNNILQNGSSCRAVFTSSSGSAASQSLDCGNLPAHTQKIIILTSLPLSSGDFNYYLSVNEGGAWGSNYSEVIKFSQSVKNIALK